MRYSFRQKLYLVISGLILFFVASSVFLNIAFLEKYYIYKKESFLKDNYTKINSLYNSKGDVELELERLERIRGVHVIVVDSQYTIIYDSMNLNKDTLKRKDNNIPDNNYGNMFKSKAAELASQKFIMEDRLDKRLQTSFLALFGKMDNGNYISLTLPVASIHDSVLVANKFFVLTGIITLVIGFVLLYIITKKLTRPIVELNNIAQKMSALDFSKRYKSRSKDEIGELGESINTLSDRLEMTISELVEANNKLKSDIENERRIDSMRKEFVSNVSHELKTPIALIQGYSEGLKLNINDDEENKNFYCDVIIDEAGKMNRLVKELLELSIIESGQAELEASTFELASLVNFVVRKNMLLLKEKEVVPVVDVPASINIRADYDKIERVLVNYLTNAINHVDKNGIIKIAAFKTGHKARISVFNSGIHIPEQSIDKIWDSFYKVDKARTREYGGTGLGLSIVRALLDLHGFNYGAVNTDNGVEFWFDADISDGTIQ